MQLPVKLAIGSVSAFFFIIFVGFFFFPRMLHSKVRGMVNLGPGTDIRDMFLKVPFALSFKVYLFNVTNPMEVQEGNLPILKEVGPFCYEEWKDKLHVEDSEGEDTISYNPRDTFIKKVWPGCRTGKEMVTIPHPMILGMVNTVMRQKPGAISLVGKAIKSIYGNPSSIFLTAKADDILFDGVPINCGVTDFAGKAICTQLKDESSLKILDDDHLSFALLSPKNATEGKRIKALRGTLNSHDVGRIIEYDGEKKISTWPDDECNAIIGTDGTIFPPFLKKEEGIVSFAADLCRSLKGFFVEKSEYNGIPVGVYSATLGDMSTNEDEKCYCYTPETCLRKGVIDLYKCNGVPIYASLPHFYDSDESYLKGVKGLTPNKTEHEIKILFESFTGSPVYASKRLQFSMPLEPNSKVELFKNFKQTVIPMFWVEEGIALNKTMTNPLKLLFTMKKIVEISKWLILLGSIGGLAAADYMFYKNNRKVDITPVHKVKPADSKSAISTVNGFDGHVNHAMSQNDVDKY